jgi:hypothetical protein
MDRMVMISNKNIHNDLSIDWLPNYNIFYVVVCILKIS